MGPPLAAVLGSRRSLLSNPTVLLLHFSTLAATASLIPFLGPGAVAHSSTAVLRSSSPEPEADYCLLADDQVEPPPIDTSAPTPILLSSLLRQKFRQATLFPSSKIKLDDALNEISTLDTPLPLFPVATILHSLLRISKARSPIVESTIKKIQELDKIEVKSLSQRLRLREETSRLIWFETSSRDIRRVAEEHCTGIDGELKAKTKRAVRQEFEGIRFGRAPRIILREKLDQAVRYPSDETKFAAALNGITSPHPLPSTNILHSLIRLSKARLPLENATFNRILNLKKIEKLTYAKQLQLKEENVKLKWFQKSTGDLKQLVKEYSAENVAGMSKSTKRAVEKEFKGVTFNDNSLLSSLLREKFRQAIRYPKSLRKLQNAINEVRKLGTPIPLLPSTTILHSLVRLSKAQKLLKKTYTSRIKENSLSEGDLDKLTQEKERPEWLEKAERDMRRLVKVACAGNEQGLRKRTRRAMQEEFEGVTLHGTLDHGLRKKTKWVKDEEIEGIDFKTTPTRHIEIVSPSPTRTLPAPELAESSSIRTPTFFSPSPLSTIPPQTPKSQIEPFLSPPPIPSILSLTHLIRRKFALAIADPHSKAKSFDALFSLRQLHLAQSSPTAAACEETGRVTWVWRLPASSVLHGLVKLGLARAGLEDAEKEIMRKILKNAEKWDGSHGGVSLRSRTTKAVKLVGLDSPRATSNALPSTASKSSSSATPSPSSLISLTHLLRSKFAQAIDNPSSKAKTFDAIFALRQLHLAQPISSDRTPLRGNTGRTRWAWRLPAASALHGLARLKRARGGVVDTAEEAIIERILGNVEIWDKVNGGESLRKKTRLSVGVKVKDVTPRVPRLRPPTLVRAYITSFMSPSSTSRSDHSRLFSRVDRELRSATLPALSAAPSRKPWRLCQRLRSLQQLALLLKHLWSQPPSKSTTTAISGLLRLLAIFPKHLKDHSRWQTGGQRTALSTHFELLQTFKVIIHSLPSSPHHPNLSIHDYSALLRVGYVCRSPRPAAKLLQLLVSSNLPITPEVSNEALKNPRLSTNAKIDFALNSVENHRTLPILINSINAFDDASSVEKLLFAVMPELDQSKPGHEVTPPPRGRNPRVYTAFLKACVRAGRTGLAERVFRSARWAAERSREEVEEGNDEEGVREEPWVLPPHAFALMLRLYADEATTKTTPTIELPSPTSRSAFSRPEFRRPCLDKTRVRGWGRAPLRIYRLEQLKARYPTLDLRSARTERNETPDFSRAEAAGIVARWELVGGSKEKERRSLRTALEGRGAKYAKVIWREQ